MRWNLVLLVLLAGCGGKVDLLRVTTPGRLGVGEDRLGQTLNEFLSRHKPPLPVDGESPELHINQPFESDGVKYKSVYGKFQQGTLTEIRALLASESEIPAFRKWATDKFGEPITTSSDSDIWNSETDHAHRTKDFIDIRPKPVRGSARN